MPPITRKLFTHLICIKLWMFLIASLTCNSGLLAQTQLPSFKPSRRSVILEWQEISGASKYELELTPIKNGELFKSRLISFKTNKAFWDGYITPGLYSMRLRSLDWRGVPGDWSESEEVTIRHPKLSNLSPMQDQTVNSKNSEKELVNFSWEGFPGALSYSFSVWSKDKKISQTVETSDSSLKITLPVATEYSWTVHTNKVQGVESDPNEEVLDFVLLGAPLEKIEIEGPKDDFVRLVKWEPVQLVEVYDVTLERYEKTNNHWSNVLSRQQTETQLDFDKDWPGGLYRLKITAKAALRNDSPLSQIEFKVRHGDRSSEAQSRFLFQQAKRRTNNWFVLASYLITEMKYQSENVDFGSSPSAKVLGGTGRLGGGYLNEKLAWGFVGIIDQSGFIFENKIYKFPAFEALAVYRASVRYDNESRFSGGIYYKEAPELLGNLRTNQFEISQLKMFGLQTGFEHLIQFDDLFGAQFNARIYLPMAGSTPNGKEIHQTPSYQLGMMGSLRLRPNAWGHAGYAYRKDIIRYPSENPSNGRYNETSITGNYLHLYLEWGL